MTKEERERKAQEYVDKITAPTKENALSSMRLSQALFLTKNGKFYSMTSDDYIFTKLFFRTWERVVFRIFYKKNILIS